ncbi:hypothetical protein SAMN04487948_13614 [Halogranum amylolyticum]|uniref:Uncharacterized protein n=1 Tax=Halogranum amylolyticum TaxID=660520 RepID=A0A1H8WQY7_9EURY|nr:hypothetical protein SAMN04487948_13614 [Halogranum amylolyticum]
MNGCIQRVWNRCSDLNVQQFATHGRNRTQMLHGGNTTLGHGPMLVDVINLDSIAAVDRVSNPRVNSWACQWTPLLPP